uniref:Uncharacterized protein n=1 Tax=Ixodes ricinus TaxID=34613 RepID=A0A6B0UQ80_IXORI
MATLPTRQQGGAALHGGTQSTQLCQRAYSKLEPIFEPADAIRSYCLRTGHTVALFEEILLPVEMNAARCSVHCKQNTSVHSKTSMAVSMSLSAPLHNIADETEKKSALDSIPVEAGAVWQEGFK